MRRRQFIRGGAAAAGTALGVSAVGFGSPRTTEAAPSTPEPSDTIMPGTAHETPVYVVEGAESGPTAVAVGGIHGDERSGILAADRLLEWDLAAGRLVVIPRANRVAVEQDTRQGEHGDLNRQFTPDSEPATELARALWDRIVEADPDVLTTLQSSKGLYGTHPDFVGQAVFPTAAGDAVTVAESATATVNDTVVPWYMPFHDFRVGHPLSGEAPLLSHKVGGDLGEPAHIVEATEYLLDDEAGARWTERLATELLAGHGLERAGGDA
ncbi:succinylglutamate desuccinylase/aspartoacylase domain-containing protein [Haloglomus halophilum]|uniref:succinylglutamate desuccinylase/aspartoacylase domain-containing protein n=1 Tax=Haloglomus halophilum TaxID=2962672 RepID=UPI0020C9B823|nr:succinylglutamate desuccinylase/aspartoacylase family protein [Haloglomus halophilum]